MIKPVVNKSILLCATAGVMLFTCSPLRASETDKRIESAAKKTYVFKTYLNHDSIKVVSHDGVVTLKGTVKEPSDKSLAEDTVAGLPGVVSVDNRLEVRGGDEYAEHSDGWIAFKVNSALLFHRNVSASATKISCQGGVVTLSGEAANPAQKDLTTEYARDVDGVTSVVNEMTISPKYAASHPEEVRHGETTGEKVDDASITAEVKATLLAHRSTSALKTHVQTREGIVTVTGIAKSTAEKDLVTHLVTDINGVVSVVNDMTVDTSLSSNN